MPKNGKKDCFNYFGTLLDFVRSAYFFGFFDRVDENDEKLTIFPKSADLTKKEQFLGSFRPKHLSCEKR